MYIAGYATMTDAANTHTPVMPTCTGRNMMPEPIAMPMHRMTHPMSYLVNGTLPIDSAEISNSFKVFKLVSLYVNTVARERDKALVRFIVLVIASLGASTAVVTPADPVQREQDGDSRSTPHVVLQANCQHFANSTGHLACAQNEIYPGLPPLQ